MRSTVDSIFAAAALKPLGVVPWNTTVPIDGPGVYAIAVTADTDSTDAAPDDSRCWTAIKKWRHTSVGRR